MLAIQHWFLPKTLKQNSKEIQVRTKFLAVNASSAIVWAAFIVPLVLYFESPLTAIFIALGALLALLAAIVLKHSDNLKISTTIYIGGLLLAMFLMCLFNGGTSFGGLSWLIMLPILATDSLSEKAGQITFSACLVFLLGFKFAEIMGIEFPMETSPEAQDYLRFTSYLILTGMIWTIGSAYSKLFQAALNKERELSHAKTKFIANVSHELRTPLNGIIGMLEVIKQQPVDQALSKDLDTIHYSSQHLLKLVNEILDLTKEHSLVKTPIMERYDIRKNIQNIVFSLSALADAKNVTLTAEITAAVPDHLFGDATKIDQLVMNFLSNAIKFTPRGRVTLHLDCHKTRAGKAELLFRIVDTGIGIAKKDLPNLFEPFYQVDDSYSREQVGSGLGLAITKSIIESLGGHVVVTSELGKGSIFSFNLIQELNEPMAVLNVASQPNLTKEQSETMHKKYSNDDQEHSGSINMSPSEHNRSVQEAAKEFQTNANPTNPSGELTNASIKNVLIAEDNPINQMILKRMLEHKGYQVSIAENGLVAFELVQQSQFDAVFIDIQMPVMDGLESTQKIRQELNITIPIIAVTASASSEDREAYLKIGINDVIHKPVVLQELSEKLEQWLPVK